MCVYSDYFRPRIAAVELVNIMLRQVLIIRIIWGVLINQFSVVVRAYTFIDTFITPQEQTYRNNCKRLVKEQKDANLCYWKCNSLKVHTNIRLRTIVRQLHKFDTFVTIIKKFTKITK